jgi:hypothetical protein
MLCAYVVTDDERYKKIAYDSMNFLISEIFNENGIEVVSNKGRYNRGDRARSYGEQPIDVAYTIIALAKFYDLTSDRKYLRLLIVAFEWFLGKNRLNQTIYNPCTGGCYDGMEEFNVNMNQGAESTVSYLLARYTIQKYKNINN